LTNFFLLCSSDSQAAARPLRGFEFPDGYNDSFGIERFRAPEVLFTPQLFANVEGVLPAAPSTHFHKPIQDLITAAIEATDVDSRATLLQNIVCVGGSTVIPGFNDRLSYELGLKLPGQKIKIHSPGNLIERKYSSWLGGSILASLGTFHQLWISKAEYQEHGANIVHTRCR
jgi:actin-related protein 4